MATARGFPRNEKPGRKGKVEDLTARAKRELERCIKYLRDELDVLLQTPGNAPEVLRIAGALDKLIAKHEPGTDHSGRGEWGLDLDG